MTGVKIEVDGGASSNILAKPVKDMLADILAAKKGEHNLFGLFPYGCAKNNLDGDVQVHSRR
jgi:hypothetical protein